MRACMIILLVLSIFDIDLIYKNGHTFKFSWLFRLASLIVFLTNF